MAIVRLALSLWKACLASTGLVSINPLEMSQCECTLWNKDCTINRCTAVSIYVTIGVFIGSIAGFFGGWVDILIVRGIEIFMSIPSFVF